MQRDARGERTREHVLQLRKQFVPGLRRNPQRRAGLFGNFAQVGWAALVARDDEGQRPKVTDLLQSFPALARIERVEPLQLLAAKNLQFVRVNDVEVTRKRGPSRAVFFGFNGVFAASLPGQPTQSKAFALLFKHFSGREPARQHVQGVLSRHRVAGAPTAD